jgi:poly(A) polymerase
MTPPAILLKDCRQILLIVLRLSERRKIKLYVVGGILRDILLKRIKQDLDIDFCLKKGAINFGREVAKALKSGFVILDKVHGSCRVVKKINGNICTLDFTDFRGKTLEDDLLHRDFTLNNMALPLEKFLQMASWKNGSLNKFLEENLIDPYGAKKDLKKKVIRMVHKKGFDEDPLRVLRAFSLASIFNFRIDKQTQKFIAQKKNKLTGVSAERVRDEVFKILSTSRAFIILEQLDKQKILDLFIPQIKSMRKLKQGPYHHLDVWGHTLQTVFCLEKIFGSLRRNEEISNYLSAEISSGRNRYALLKFAGLLHDIGKPKTLRIEKGKIKFYGHDGLGARMAEDICEKLKLSNVETRMLKLIVLCHLRPGYMANNYFLTKRAKFRFFRDTGQEAPSVLLLSLADQRATRGYLTVEKSRRRHEGLVRRLIKEYFYCQKEKKAARLVNGNDLIAKFKLSPSPLIGKILLELSELQAIGKIKTKEEAFGAAAIFLKKYK